MENCDSDEEPQSESGVCARNFGDEDPNLGDPSEPGWFGTFHAKGAGPAREFVEGAIRSLGSSVNLVVFDSAISSISSKDGMEIVGRIVSMPFAAAAIVKEERMLLYVGAGVEPASNSRRRG